MKLTPQLLKKIILEEAQKLSQESWTNEAEETDNDESDDFNEVDHPDESQQGLGEAEACYEDDEDADVKSESSSPNGFILERWAKMANIIKG